MKLQFPFRPEFENIDYLQFSSNSFFSVLVFFLLMNESFKTTRLLYLLLQKLILYRETIVLCSIVYICILFNSAANAEEM